MEITEKVEGQNNYPISISIFVHYQENEQLQNEMKESKSQLEDDSGEHISQLTDEVATLSEQLSTKDKEFSEYVSYTLLTLFLITLFRLISVSILPDVIIFL